MFSAILPAMISAMLLAILLAQAVPASALAATGISYTHITPEGNRYTRLTANLPDTMPLDIPLEGQPAWVLGMGNLWAVVLSDGRTQAFTVKGRTFLPASVISEGVRADAPPALIKTQKGYILVSSGHTSPLISEDNKRAEIRNYQMFVDNEKIPITPLYDSRLLADESDRMLLLTGPTQSYKHGALGDTTEASGFAILSGKEIVSRVKVQGGVIEGTSAIWADMDGDDLREVILTVSDYERGSRIVLYSEEGRLVAAGPPVGLGYRWVHQIAVAPFGPGGQMEIATVKTPHIGGTVEFLALKGKALRLSASIAGYSSHVNGLRNLDMAVAGDFDSDGKVELLVPTDSMEALAGLGRTQDGAVEKWRLNIPGRLMTNIAITEVEGHAAVGIGIADTAGIADKTRTDGRPVLRLWLP